MCEMQQKQMGKCVAPNTLEREEKSQTNSLHSDLKNQEKEEQNKPKPRK